MLHRATCLLAAMGLLATTGACRRFNGYDLRTETLKDEVVETPTNTLTKPYWEVAALGDSATVRGRLMRDRTIDRHREVVTREIQQHVFTGPGDGERVLFMITGNIFMLTSTIDLIARLAGSQAIGPTYEKHKPSYLRRLWHWLPTTFWFTHPTLTPQLYRIQGSFKRIDVSSEDKTSRTDLASLQRPEPLAEERFTVTLLDDGGGQLALAQATTSPEGTFEVGLTQSLTRFGTEAPITLRLSAEGADPWQADFGCLEYPPYVVSRKLWETLNREQELIPLAQGGNQDAQEELIGLWISLPEETTTADAKTWLRELGKRHASKGHHATALLFLGIDRNVLNDRDSRLTTEVRNAAEAIIKDNEFAIALRTEGSGREASELLARLQRMNWGEVSRTIRLVRKEAEANAVFTLEDFQIVSEDHTSASTIQHTFQRGMMDVPNPDYAAAQAEVAKAQANLQKAQSAQRTASTLSMFGSMVPGGSNFQQGMQIGSAVGGAGTAAAVADATNKVSAAQTKLMSTPMTIQEPNIVTEPVPIQLTRREARLSGELVLATTGDAGSETVLPIDAAAHAEDKHWTPNASINLPGDPLTLPPPERFRSELLDAAFKQIREAVRRALLDEASLKVLNAYDAAMATGDDEAVVEAGLRFLFLVPSDHADYERVATEVESRVGVITGNKTTVRALMAELRR